MAKTDTPNATPAAPEQPVAGGSYTYDAAGKLVVVEQPQPADNAAATYPKTKE